MPSGGENNAFIRLFSYPPVMVSLLQVAAFFHVLFGVIWVGTSLYIDIAWIRPWRATKTVAELKVWQGVLRPTGPFIGISSLLVILTGLVYMFMKYGTDLGLIWASSSGRLVLISLALVLVAFFIGLGVNNRTAMKLVKMPLPDDAEAPIPKEASGLMDSLMKSSMVATIIIVVVLLLMVLGATGGL